MMQASSMAYRTIVFYTHITEVKIKLKYNMQITERMWLYNFAYNHFSKPICKKIVLRVYQKAILLT